MLIARLNNFKCSLHCEKVNERLVFRDKALFERIRVSNFFIRTMLRELNKGIKITIACVLRIVLCSLSKLLI